MTPPSRDQVLAASAGWVAVLLNVVPGLGAGYLYQRRWRAYWITSAVATAWFVAGAVLAQDADAAAEAQNQLVGLIGLLVLAGVTATEAGLALKRGGRRTPDQTFSATLSWLNRGACSRSNTASIRSASGWEIDSISASTSR